MADKNDGVDPSKNSSTNYDTWSWKEIKVAVNGGVSMSNQDELDDRKGVANPQSLWNAGYSYSTVQSSLQTAKDTLDKHVTNLKENWKGPTATSFQDFMKKFQGNVDGHLNAIKGPPDYTLTLNAQGDALIKAQNTIADVDYRVANKVVKYYVDDYNRQVEEWNNDPGKQFLYGLTFTATGTMPKWDPPWHDENGTTIVHVSRYDWAVKDLEQGMRPAIKDLAQSYKTGSNDLRDPQATQYPSSSTADPPPRPKDLPPPPKPKDPPPPPKAPPPPKPPPLPKQQPPPNLSKQGPPGGPLGGAHLPPGAAGLGPHGELLGPDGKPLLGPNGELLGPDGRPLRGPNGELLGPDGRPLTDPRTKLAGGLQSPGTADLDKLRGPGGALPPGVKRIDPPGGRLPLVGASGGPQLPSLKSLSSGSPKGLGKLGGAGGLGKLGGAGGLGKLGGPGSKLGGAGALGGPRGKLAGQGAEEPFGAGGGRGGLGRGAAGAGAGRGAGGGMPYGGAPHGGAGHNKGEERERTTWLLEDEDVWGANSDAGSGVLGRAD